jgi:hypothetical protein
MVKNNIEFYSDRPIKCFKCKEPLRTENFKEIQLSKFNKMLTLGYKCKCGFGGDKHIGLVPTKGYGW